MAIIKCKMCGGDVELSADKTIGLCEYCGSTMTFPKVDDDQRAAQFNRGNHFRRLGEFDTALGIYENIVRENDDDAEAHWCCALCRFGIEYVEDPATHEWLPTCHRASFDSFLEDVDYLAALEHSNGVTKRQYEKDAAKIAEVQRGILATSQKEEPFDVFICYKETDDNNQRTRDSMLAQDVYYQLTEKGYRVFFSRITLEDKAGSEYEPYIFAALNSARVMVCIGTKPEHFNAVWVKNEWSRYLALMRKDRKKLLLPCYRDMDPYALPEQLKVLQSYDMSKIGFIQDLIRGISKVVDAEKASAQPAPAPAPARSEGGTTAEALLTRGRMALEDGEWSDAASYYDHVLNLNPQCAEAYLGKFLAAKRAATLEKYVESELARLGSGQVQKLTAVEQDNARITAALARYGVERSEEKKQWARFNFYRSYDSTLASRQAQKQPALAAFDAEKLLNRANQFADEKLRAELSGARKALEDGLDARIAAAQAEDAASIARIKEAYEAHLTQGEEQLAAEKRKREDAEEKKRAEDYMRACAKQDAAKTATACREAGHQFRSLGDYRDSAARAEACAKRADALEAAAKKRKKAIVAAAIGAAVVVAVIVVLAVKLIIPSSHYKKGEAFLAAEDYDGAVTEFTAAGEYRDAEERLQVSYYAQAGALEEAGEVARAAIAYGRAGEHADAAERSRALWDQAAERNSISAGGEHTVGLKSDGTVVAVGSNEGGQCNVSDWTDIVAIAAGYNHTVGLKSDGTVIAVGNNGRGRCDVSDWTDIVAIAAGFDHTVGLKSDGTAVAVGNNRSGQCDVSGWMDIVAVAAGDDHTVGLKYDGTVVAVGGNQYGQCNVSGWTDIVAVAAGNYHTVGLKSDGTVVAAGSNGYGQCDVSDWTDIVAVAAGVKHTVGLKSDGTVVAVGANDDGQCDVSDWTDVVAIAAGHDHTVGLKSDGTVIAVGETWNGQCNVSGWTDIKLPG